MKTIDKIYSVSNKNYIQFKIDMSNGDTYSAYNDNFHFNCKNMTADGWCFDVNTTDVDVVKDAIWCVANGWLNIDKPITKYAITKALKNKVKIN